MRYAPLLMLLGSLSLSVPAQAAKICYEGTLTNGETQPARCDGEMLGTVGQSVALESIKIFSPKPENGEACRLMYRVHAQDVGWMGWIHEFESELMGGNAGTGLRLEAIEVKLLDCPNISKLRYRVHVQDIGWMDWVDSGQTAGTVGRSLRMEAIEMVIEEATSQYDYKDRPYPFYDIKTGEVSLPTLGIFRNDTLGYIQTKLTPVQGLFSFSVDKSPSFVTKDNRYRFESPEFNKEESILTIPYLIVENNNDIDIFDVTLRNSEENKEVYFLNSIKHLPVPVSLDTFNDCFDTNLPGAAGFTYDRTYVRAQEMAYSVYEDVTGKIPADNNKGKAVMRCCTDLYHSIWRIPGFKHDNGKSCINAE